MKTRSPRDSLSEVSPGTLSEMLRRLREENFPWQSRQCPIARVRPAPEQRSKCDISEVLKVRGPCFPLASEYRKQRSAHTGLPKHRSSRSRELAFLTEHSIFKEPQKPTTKMKL